MFRFQILLIIIITILVNLALWFKIKFDGRLAFRVTLLLMIVTGLIDLYIRIK